MQNTAERLLLREHAHRVANDMAVAAAALRVAQRRTGPDAGIATAIARVEASAAVHRLLCATHDGRTVDLVVSLNRLCAAMRHAHAGGVALASVEGTAVPVRGEHAWLVSMCVHELVSNALRHCGTRAASVRVEVDDDGFETMVAVLDGGGARQWSRPGGQGATIVDELAKQLGGTVERSHGPAGGRVAIMMPTILVADATRFEVA